MTNTAQSPEAGPPAPPHLNRLAKEQSPYLLQHQHNPVDWYPWGEEAFAKAKAEEKPIFLSIGYATCHWCHVMERESFENPPVAAFLNEHFVSIKVDREERPDVDRVYMNAVQALGVQGGWPLSAFLAPDLKPFYGGTYFPPENRHQLPGFLTVLRQIAQLWRDRRNDLLHSASELHRRLAQHLKGQAPGETVLTEGLLHEAAARFSDEYDAKEGGFGGAPKFPRPAVPLFLLRYGSQYRDEDAIDMVLFTCQRMAAGGIHDHLGGGFARYAVDGQWRVPHFEKMLYDNAQLAHLYLEAYQVSGHTQYRRVAEDIFGYVLRDMTHPEGGFFSAEDADSEGKEGKFYCWTRNEVAQMLSSEEFRVAERCYGLTEQGNFIDHSDPDPLRGQNVLNLQQPPTQADEQRLLEQARQKLLAARQRRIRPFLDDKILTSWNGLMLGALARGSALLDNDLYRQAARANFAFLKSRLWDAESESLCHRWRQGQRDAVSLLDASAFGLLGVLDWYEATLDPEVLAFAIQAAEAMLREFYDPAQGGFWQSNPRTQHLIFRLKDDYDGAEPAGNTAATLGLLRLHAITGRSGYRQAAEQTLRWLCPRLERMPQALPFGLIALHHYLTEPVRIVLVGDLASPAGRRLLSAAHQPFLPCRTLLGTAGEVDPFTRTLAANVREPTAFVCIGKTCRLPITSPEALLANLRQT